MNSILGSLFVRRIWLVFVAFALLPAKSLLAATPLHHYDFNGNAVRDLVGSLDGALLYRANVQGGVLSLGWDYGYVQFSTNLLPSKPPFSVAFFAQEDERLAQYVQNTSLRIDDLILGTGPFALDGEWHHYAVTVTTNQIRVYIDGHFARSILPAYPLEGRSTTRLGPEFAANDVYFKGLIDEFWTFDGLLSVNEVLNLSTQVHSANPQTVTWTDAPNDFLALNVAYPLGAAVASSGLPVTLRVDHGPAVIANGKITITGAGTVWVTAEQAGDAFYANASKSRVFNMRQAAVSFAGQYADPASAPVRLDEFNTGDNAQVVGNLMYTTDYGELSIYDLTATNEPTLIAQYYAPPFDFGSRAVRVSGNYVYLLTYQGFLHILEGDPTNLVLVGSSQMMGNSIDVAGDYLFVASSGSDVGDAYSPGGVRVFDVSNPARIVEVGGYRGRIAATRVEVVDDIAYVLDGSAVVALKVTLQQPPEPRLALSAPESGSAYNISILSSPFMPGWEMQVSPSVAPNEAAWVNWDAVFGEGVFEERDGIQRFRVSNRTLFFRMRKTDL